MNKVSDFDSFSDLFNYCLSLSSKGNDHDAFELISEYIRQAKDRETKNEMWGWWHIQQAMELKPIFSEDKIQSEKENLAYCEKYFTYYSNALAEINAKISMIYQDDGNYDMAITHSKSALHYSSLTGRLSQMLIDVFLRNNIKAAGE